MTNSHSLHERNIHIVAIILPCHGFLESTKYIFLFHLSFGAFLSQIQMYVSSSFLIWFWWYLYPCKGGNILYTFLDISHLLNMDINLLSHVVSLKGIKIPILPFLPKTHFSWIISLELTRITYYSELNFFCPSSWS